MGCCSAINQLLLDRPRSSSPESFVKREDSAISTLASDFVVPIGSLSSILIFCKETNKYFTLLAFIDDETAVHSYRPCPKWACIPKTRSCAVISIINKHLEANTLRIDEKVLMQHSESILNQLEKGSTALKQHLVYFLSLLVERRFGVVLHLLEHNLFECLKRMMLHGLGELRESSAKLCMKICEKDEDIKKCFFENDGMKFVLTQISLGRMNNLKEQLYIMKGLLLDRNCNPIHSLARILFNEIDNSLSKRIQRACVTREEKELFNDLHYVITDALNN